MPFIVSFLTNNIRTSLVHHSDHRKRWSFTRQTYWKTSWLSELNDENRSAVFTVLGLFCSPSISSLIDSLSIHSFSSSTSLRSLTIYTRTLILFKWLIWENSSPVLVDLSLFVSRRQNKFRERRKRSNNFWISGTRNWRMSMETGVFISTLTYSQLNSRFSKYSLISLTSFSTWLFEMVTNVHKSVNQTEEKRDILIDWFIWSLCQKIRFSKIFIDQCESCDRSFNSFSSLIFAANRTTHLSIEYSKISVHLQLLLFWTNSFRTINCKWPIQC